MPILQFYRRPAATEITLRQLIKLVNDKLQTNNAVVPITRIESEYIYYTELSKDSLTKEGT
jgi:hypothetical protein